MQFPPLSTSDEFIWPKAKPTDSLQDKIYRHVVYLLSCGYFRPGEKISLRQLSSALDVSETPVRIAFNRLTAESALDVHPNQHVSIPALTREQFTELTELRVDLEVRITAIAAQRVSEAEIDELERINNELLEAIKDRKTQNCIELNRRFHLSLYETAQRPLTFSLIFGLWIRAGAFMHASLRSDGVVWRTKQHLDLVAALRARDVDMCKIAIRRDIQDTYDELIKIPHMFVDRQPVESAPG